ncbi:MAG: hypothetical protein WAM04_11025 [Candidatus Sulfotelmatobacter sp.]
MNATASIGPFSLATDSAKEAVLVANTPSFLLDRLRKDVAVQTVLDNMNSREIVVALRETLARPAKSPAELVPAYVYLVALSSADPQDEALWKQISSIDLSGLEWGDTIRAVISAEAVPTTALEFSVCDKLSK